MGSCSGADFFLLCAVQPCSGARRRREEGRKEREKEKKRRGRGGKGGLPPRSGFAHARGRKAGAAEGRAALWPRKIFYTIYSSPVANNIRADTEGGASNPMLGRAFRARTRRQCVAPVNPRLPACCWCHNMSKSAAEGPAAAVPRQKGEHYSYRRRCVFWGLQGPSDFN